MRAVLAAVAMLVVGASGTQAATVTFDGIGQVSSGGIWAEDGITATAGGGALGYYGSPDRAHMDDGGSYLAGAITFTMGGRFDAIGFDIFPSTSHYFYCETSVACDPASFENVQVVGLRDNTLVALSTFDMFAVRGHYAFGSEFSNLDSLLIGFAAMPPFFWDATLPGAACYDSPCTHFDIDNVTLALATPSPVPLPASAALMLTGLAGLAGLGWRRRYR